MRVQGYANLTLGLARRDEQAQPLVSEQIDGDRRVCGRALDRTLEALCVDPRGRHGGAAAGLGVGGDERLNPPRARALGLLRMVQQGIELLMLLYGDAGLLLQTAQAIDLCASGCVGAQHGRIAAVQGALEIIESGPAPRHAPRCGTRGEVVELLRFEELQHLETLIDPPALHEPVRDGAIHRDLVEQEAAVEPLVLAAEVLALALDLRDRALAEENRERRASLRIQGARGDEVRARERLGSPEAFGRGDCRCGERMA